MIDNIYVYEYCAMHWRHHVASKAATLFPPPYKKQYKMVMNRMAQIIGERESTMVVRITIKGQQVS
jgi:hypothetical protein